MNNPKFYIYGVPDGFNMLSGTPEEILYYQLFYDTSRQGREMRINRKANGETVYSYLIYNLVSCKGRAGAFLGFSVVFYGNEYCTNPATLQELFEGVYNEVILKAEDKDKIIAPIENGSAVGKFCISKFDERQEMCEKIGRIIVNNIAGELTNSVATFDDRFSNGKEGRILTLPINSDNVDIIQAFREYTWVSLSTEYKAAPIIQPEEKGQKQTTHKTPISIGRQDLLSVHFTDGLANKVSSYKDFIIRGLKGQTSTEEISAKRGEINHYLDTLEEYAGRQPELSKLKDDYISIYKEIIALNPQIHSDNQQVSPQPFKRPNNDIKNNWLKLLMPYLPKIAIAAAGVLAVILVIVLWPSGGTEEKKKNEDAAEVPKQVADEFSPETNDANNLFDKVQFDSLLDCADYKTAWSMLSKVEDEDKHISLARTLQNSYSNWFNQEFKNKETNLKGLQDLKEEITAYADFNQDNERNNRLLDDQIAKLQREAPKEEKTIKAGTPLVIMIYKADRDYNYMSSNAISVKNNTIKCKRNDCFVVEGATLKSKDDRIEAVPKDGKIRIRTPNTGKHSITLNENKYTFNVDL